jgi:hypothetical protein
MAHSYFGVVLWDHLPWGAVSLAASTLATTRLNFRELQE